MEMEPDALHQRCPFLVGSAAMVEKVEEFLAKEPALQEAS